MGGVMRLSKIQQLLVLFTVLAAGNVLSAEPVDPVPGWSIQASGRAVHIASGVVFPSTIGNFVRQLPHIYEPSGQNASIDFKRADPPLTATFYVYPRTHGEPDPADEFQASLSAALNARPGSTLVDAERTQIGKKPRRVKNGFIASFYWSDTEGDFGGWLLLAANKEWFYKVRTSCHLSKECVADSVRLAIDLIQNAEFGPE